MIKYRKMAVVVLLFVSGMFLLSGCETLRKKFTRKRKSKDSTETVVIVPRDYSAHPFANDVLYKQYFVYWKSWNQELVSSLSEAENYKKIDECIDQSLTNMKKMQTYLKEEKAKELGVFVNKTEVLKDEIMAAKNMPPAQMNRLRYSADRILSNVNRNFDLKKMKDHLK